MSPSLPEHHVVVRLSALGDVVLTTGVLRYWHQRHGWTFTVITRPAFAPVFDGHPAVRAVQVLEDDALRGRALRERWRQLAEACAGQRLIDLHGTGRTRLLAWYWKGPVARYAKRGLTRRIFLASGGRFGGAALRRHNVPQRYALAVEREAPARAELLPEIFLSPAERDRGLELARLAGFREDAPLIALHPYAAHRGKTWPREHWLRLMEALDAHGRAWCVIGQADHARLPGVPACRDLTNHCSVRESAALLSACAALVTGDSGPMHLAGAVGVPVVALFGSTAPEWGFYPEGSRDLVLERELACRPCTLHGAEACPRAYACLEGISVEAVMRALGLGAVSQ